MAWRLARVIVLLPGTVTIVVPAVLIAAQGVRPGWALGAALAPLLVVLDLALIGAGLGLWVWTARLFVRIGIGTPAPWDPPRRLVVPGPYRQVRNPMIIGLIAILLGEAAWPIACAACSSSRPSSSSTPRSPRSSERPARPLLVEHELEHASRRAPLGQAVHRLGVDRPREEHLVPTLRPVEASLTATPARTFVTSIVASDPISPLSAETQSAATTHRSRPAASAEMRQPPASPPS